MYNIYLEASVILSVTQHSSKQELLWTSVKWNSKHSILGNQGIGFWIRLFYRTGKYWLITVIEWGRHTWFPNYMVQLLVDASRALVPLHCIALHIAYCTLHIAHCTLHSSLSILPLLRLFLVFNGTSINMHTSCSRILFNIKVSFSHFFPIKVYKYVY